jgi:hypothetical protein
MCKLCCKAKQVQAAKGSSIRFICRFRYSGFRLPAFEQVQKTTNCLEKNMGSFCMWK